MKNPGNAVSTGNYQRLSEMIVGGPTIELDKKYQGIPGTYGLQTGWQFKTRQTKCKTKVTVTRIK